MENLRDIPYYDHIQETEVRFLREFGRLYNFTIGENL